MLSAVIPLMLVALLFLPLQYLVLAASTRAVSQVYLGKPASILGSYRSMFPRFLGFLGLVFVTAICIGLGFLACIVPGVYLAFRWSLVAQVFVIEGKGIFESWDRSKELAHKQVERIFVVGILSVMMAWIASQILQLPAAFLGFTGVGWIVQGVSAGIAQAVTAPIQVIAFVLLYYDIRVRQEGFDLELLAESLGETLPAAPQAIEGSFIPADATPWPSLGLAPKESEEVFTLVESTDGDRAPTTEAQDAGTATEGPSGGTPPASATDGDRRDTPEG